MLRRVFILCASFLFVSHLLFAANIVYRDHTGSVVKQPQESQQTAEGGSVAEKAKNLLSVATEKAASLGIGEEILIDDFGLNIAVKRSDMLGNFRFAEKVDRKYRLFSISIDFNENEPVAKCALASARILDLYLARSLYKKGKSDELGMSKAKGILILPANNAVYSKLKSIAKSLADSKTCVSIKAKKLKPVAIEQKGSAITFERQKDLWLIFDVETMECAY